MAVIQGNQAWVPFLGDRFNFVKGLDPLGLQNATERAFTLLLPGLNNVSSRIRYYSFYCWLLDHYSKEIRIPESRTQKEFVRKAEYLIALLANVAEPALEGIPGSLYAGKEVQKEQSVYVLSEGIYNDKGGTEDTYWKYGFGILGQYYVGSLKDIGLITLRDQEDTVYLRTASREGVIAGSDIANAFNQNIPERKKQLFFAAIENDQIRHEDLLALLPEFNFLLVPENTEEEKLLIQLLQQQDYPRLQTEHPAHFRKESIRHYLRFLNAHPQQKPSDRPFTFFAYQQKGRIDGDLDECLRGWYFYQFHEYWQYACTAILNGMMDFLEELVGPSFYPAGRFVDKVRDECLVRIMGSSTETASCHVFWEQNEWKQSVEELYHRNQSEKKIDRIVSAFFMIWRLYEENASQLGEMREYFHQSELGTENEFNSIHYISGIPGMLDQNLGEYLKRFLAYHILYRHQFVAFRKMNGAKSTQKFVIEDNAIRYIGNFDPGFSSPRLSTLINFLTDLKLVNPLGGLEKSGQELLQSIS